MIHMLERLFSKKPDRKQFEANLIKMKENGKDRISFYPYNSIHNLYQLDLLLLNTGWTPEKILATEGVNDIGGADGDLAFYAEYIGASKVSLVDNAPTNFNQLKGAQFLKEQLHSNVNIKNIDLDSSGVWDLVDPAGITIFLGILYHLKNPFFALSELSKKSEYLLLSTKVFDVLPGIDVSSYPLSYFYTPGECNNDNTNWWCFTDECLKRMLDRAGWSIIAYRRFGCERVAEPSSLEKDGRAFAFLKRKGQPGN